MSGYKTFAIAGAGNIGKPIIEELVNLKKQGTISSIIVLTRSSESHASLAALGTTPSTVSYDDEASLQSALKGVDVVISTLSGRALSAQDTLALAAKKAGVKLFAPSEFGFPTKGHTEGIFGAKNAFREQLVELGIPFACFYVGMFSDTTFIPMMGFDLEKGDATIGGSGDKEISFTSSTDIARFVAHALTALPKSKVENSFFAIEGERTTINKVLTQYQERTGKTFHIEHIPIEDVKAALKANPGDFISAARLRWDTDGTVGSSEKVSNAEWPEWNPKKVLEVLLD